MVVLQHRPRPLLEVGRGDQLQVRLQRHARRLAARRRAPRSSAPRGSAGCPRGSTAASPCTCSPRRTRGRRCGWPRPAARSSRRRLSTGAMSSTMVAMPRWSPSSLPSASASLDESRSGIRRPSTRSGPRARTHRRGDDGAVDAAGEADDGAAAAESAEDLGPDGRLDGGGRAFGVDGQRVDGEGSPGPGDGHRISVSFNGISTDRRRGSSTTAVLCQRHAKPTWTWAAERQGTGCQGNSLPLIGAVRLIKLMLAPDRSA